MAYKADITLDHDTPPLRGDDVRQQLNNLADDLRALRDAFGTLVTKLNADAGVTDANYAAPADTTFKHQKIGR